MTFPSFLIIIIMAATTTTMDNAPVETRSTHSHFSHHHPLEVTASSATASVNCSGCTLPIVGSRDYYSCPPCSFFLHSACFKMPSSILHPADPGHHLTLTLLQNRHPAAAAAASRCRACALSLGEGLSYHCPNCCVHYHSLCLFRPTSKTHPSHHHTLSLRFSAPYGPGEGFRCDVCRNPGLPDQWLYRCDTCGFDSHVDCSAVPAAPTTTSRAPLTSPDTGNAPPSAPPPVGYPPPGYGGAMTNNVQQQQQQVMGPATAAPVWYHPVAGQQPPPQAVVGGGYPFSNYGYNNMQQQPQPQQMGMGSLIMTSVVAGGAQGVAGGLVDTAFNGFSGGGDGSSSSYPI